MTPPRKLALLIAAVLSASLLALVPQAQGATTSLTKVGQWETHYGEFYANAHTEQFSTAAIGDVTGDGKPDVIVGGSDGRVYGFHANGSRFLAFNMGPGAVSASPALVDFNRDGVLDILAANEGGPSFSSPGRVAVMTGGGHLLFDRRDHCWSGKPCGFFSTPTAADIDRDGQLEVVATSWNHYAYAWNHDGSLVSGWPVFVYDTIWSSPTVADLDGDGWLEIVFGGDMDHNGVYPAGGLVWVLRHNGARQPNFPRSLPGQVIWSSPAVTDLDGDGGLDIVVGTGLNWSGSAGRVVYALNRFGGDLPGWPQAVAGRVMGSPAVGDIDGDGRNEVVSLSEGGWVYAHEHTGHVRWRVCAMNPGHRCDENGDVPTHSSPVIADVDGDGRQEVLATGEHTLLVFDGATGGLEASGAVDGRAHAAAAAPSVASIGGKVHIVQHIMLDANGDGRRNAGDRSAVAVWRTGATTGGHAWPTFKQNMRRTGFFLDTTPPTAGISKLVSQSTSTKMLVEWVASDVGTGISRFELHVRENSGSWAHWITGGVGWRSGSSAGGKKYLYGRRGQTYTVRVRAVDHAGNVGAWAYAKSDVSSTATKVQPFLSAYGVRDTGRLTGVSSAPMAGPRFHFDIARDVAVRSSGGGGYVLDGYGGLHAFGGAPKVSTSGYWYGWDIARGVALNRDGSGYVLDGYGGLHPVGGAAAVKDGPYWPSWDIAHDIVLLPTSTKSSPAGYILDDYGAVHAFGAAPAVKVSGYWPGWKIVRGFTANVGGKGGYVLDGFGGLHPFGGAPAVKVGGYWHGWDIARGVAAISAGKGYVIDGFGGLHPYGGAPGVATTHYIGRDVYTALSIAPG